MRRYSDILPGDLLTSHGENAAWLILAIEKTSTGMYVTYMTLWSVENVDRRFAYERFIRVHVPQNTEFDKEAKVVRNGNII